MGKFIFVLAGILLLLSGLALSQEPIEECCAPTDTIVCPCDLGFCCFTKVLGRQTRIRGYSQKCKDPLGNEPDPPVTVQFQMVEHDCTLMTPVGECQVVGSCYGCLALNKCYTNFKLTSGICPEGYGITIPVAEYLVMCLAE